MSELLCYAQSDLPVEYACQVLSFLRVHWPGGFTGENRLRSWITRAEDHPVSYLLVEAGLVISHAQVVWKSLDHAGETYKAYGITGVLTFPSFRDQGYGLRVVQAATDAIARSDADVGMFFCDPGLADFYARCGWLPMPDTITWLGPRDGLVASDELLMMQFFSEKGRRGRAAFERGPVYFQTYDTW